MRPLTNQLREVSPLSGRTIDRLTYRAALVNFASGNGIFRENDLAANGFYVIDGPVLLGRLSDANGSPRKPTSVENIGFRNTFLGLGDIIDGGVYRDNAYALDITQALRVPTVDILDLYGKELDFTSTVGILLAREGRYVKQSKYCDLDVKGRLVRFLVDYARARFSKEALQEVALPLKQELIAAIVHPSRETVNKRLAELNREGVMRKEAPGAIVFDVATLEEYLSR
jgi:CRP-like cAMP-binding protein